MTEKKGGEGDFGERLSLLIRRYGSRAALARAAGIRDSTLQMCVARGTDPSLRVLVALSRTTGKSIEWLATGREPAPQAISLLDAHQLAISIKTVLEALKQTDAAASPATIAEMVTIYYEEWEEHEYS